MVEGSPVASPKFSPTSLGEATKAISDAASSATKQAVDAIEAAGESAGKAFGSPAPASPLEHAAKQLDFGAGKPEPATPATPAAIGSATGGKAGPAVPLSTPAAAGVSDEDDIDYNAFLKDTLLWTRPVRSAVYLVAGVALILLTQRLVSSKLTLVTGVTYVLLFQLALNFFRFFVSPRLQERCTWADSAWTYAAVHQFGVVLKGAAAVHDAHLNGSDADKTLKIGAALWVLSLAGRGVSALGLALTLWLGAFIAPKAVLLLKPRVQPQITQVLDTVRGHLGKLDVRARAALVAVPILVAGWVLTRIDLAIALFLLAVYGRCWLKQSNVDAINKRVAPITATATKVGGTVSKFVGDAAAKYELTPTPAKAKRA